MTKQQRVHVAFHTLPVHQAGTDFYNDGTHFTAATSRTDCLPLNGKLFLQLVAILLLVSHLLFLHCSLLLATTTCQRRHSRHAVR